MRITKNVLKRKPRFTGAATSVAAAGSAQSSATALTGSINSVTASDDAKGVILPANYAAGDMVFVMNTVSNKTLKVYPQSGGDINNGSDNAAITMRAAQAALFISLGSENWAAIYDTDTTA